MNEDLFLPQVTDKQVELMATIAQDVATQVQTLIRIEAKKHLREVPGGERGLLQAVMTILQRRGQMR